MELTDKKIHGRYIGILLGPAAAGASFEECLVEMSIDGNGITMPFTEVDDDDSKFLVHYPPEMVFHLLGWGMDKDLAIRQHADSDLASVIINQVPWYRKIISYARTRTTADLTVILGEGMPMPLMLFVHEKRGKRMLRRMYQKIAGAQSDNYYAHSRWDDDALVEVDSSTITRISEKGSFDEKKKLIEHLGHNLWTGTSETIAVRITMLNLFLNDSDLMVRREVMQMFTLGARVTEAVSVLEQQFKWLQGKDFYQPDVGMYATTVADAATCLLYEAYNALGPQVRMKQRFGSLSMGNIRAQVNGTISARDEKMFTAFLRARDRSTSRRWTTEHYLILRTIALELSKHQMVFVDPMSQQDLAEYAGLIDDIGVLQNNRVN